MIFARRTVLAAAAALAIFAAGLLPGLGMEPPTKEQIQRYKLDGTLARRVAQARAFGNHKIPQRIADRLTAKLARLSTVKDGRAAASSVQAPPRAWEGMPTSGNVRMLALLISFSDYPGTTAPATFESRLFGSGSGSPPFDSLKNFYERSSYGQLSIAGDVLGWYQAPYARSTVAETDAGRQNLIKEALDYYEAQGHDFSQYDNDGDGTIDYFCVFWTGPHGEWASFWWGYYTWFSDSAYRLDGKRLTNYSWQWELYNYPSGSFGPSVDHPRDGARPGRSRLLRLRRFGRPAGRRRRPRHHGRLRRPQLLLQVHAGLDHPHGRVVRGADGDHEGLGALSGRGPVHAGGLGRHLRRILHGPEPQPGRERYGPVHRLGRPGRLARRRPARHLELRLPI